MEVDEEPRSPLLKAKSAPKCFESPCRARSYPTPGRSPPITPCTPTRPFWRQRCEEACLRLPFPCSFALYQGQKRQDRLAIECKSQSSGEAFWGVFDGHISHDVAGYASQTVPGLVWASPHWPANPGEALRGALQQCHEGARREGLTGGSTAVVVAYAAGAVWCACAGDSRAVVAVRGGGARRLSVDHVATDPGEVARIRATGARLDFGRLGGILPMTRGLGNFRMESDGFACLPDVASVSRWAIDFVVIATDGMWDVINDEQCCALVRSWGGAAACVPAERLAAHARRLGSTDDIAVIVVFFPLVGTSGLVDAEMASSVAEPCGDAGHPPWLQGSSPWALSGIAGAGA